MISSLQEIARALGGEVAGPQVLAPGPYHRPIDRSLTVRLSPGSPDGFIVHSFAGDNFRDCRDHVLARLGIVRRERRRPDSEPRRASETPPDAVSPKVRKGLAARLWNEASPARGTLAEMYLRSRGIEWCEDYGDALRFHPTCGWKEGEGTIRVPCMVAAMRSIMTNELTAVHRTRLTLDGKKVERRMLGIAEGTAVKLDNDAEVTTGLTIGEGIETVLTARQMGFRPVWAMGSAGAIGAFPVLAGVDSLTFLQENDPTSARFVTTCATRWHAAGREAIIVRPKIGSDMNDIIKGVA